MAVRETERDEMATAVQRIQDESRRREKEMHSTLNAVSKWFSNADVQAAIDEERARALASRQSSRQSSRRSGGGSGVRDGGHGCRQVLPRQCDESFLSKRLLL